MTAMADGPLSGARPAPLGMVFPALHFLRNWDPISAEIILRPCLASLPGGSAGFSRRARLDTCPDRTLIRRQPWASRASVCGRDCPVIGQGRPHREPGTAGNRPPGKSPAPLRLFPCFPSGDTGKEPVPPAFRLVARWQAKIKVDSMENDKALTRHLANSHLARQAQCAQLIPRNLADIVRLPCQPADPRLLPAEADLPPGRAPSVKAA
jgi:hypothetical protein